MVSEYHYLDPPNGHANFRGHAFECRVDHHENQEEMRGNNNVIGNW